MIRTALIGRGLGGSVFHEPLIRACEGLDLVRIAGAAEAEATGREPGQSRSRSALMALPTTLSTTNGLSPSGNQAAAWALAALDFARART